MNERNSLTLIIVAGWFLLPGCRSDSPSEPVAGPATALSFATVPSQIFAGTAFSITVRALDENNVLASTFVGSISLSKSSGPGTLTGTLMKNAVSGSATFNDLVVDTAGSYTFSAASGNLSGATTDPVIVQPSASAPIVTKTGVFVSQSGYTTAGTVEILRNPDGSEFLRTASNFSVSGGAGAIGIWLTNSSGAASLNNTTEKERLGVITSGFAGTYEYDVPGGLGIFTHIVSFCEGAQINFGNAALMDP